VGGLRGLKAWLEKRRNAFTPEAKEVGDLREWARGRAVPAS
jgi:hypothetical protein